MKINTCNKLKKTVMAGLCLAVMAGSAVFTGCQLNLEQSDVSLTAERNEISDSRNIGDRNLTDSEKIGKIYDKITEKKAYEYKGEKIAATRVTAALTDMIPVDDIEDPTVKYFAKAGIRALDAGMQALDHFLNESSFGFYGVATSIFWPEENTVGKETQMILDKIDEVSGQISDMEAQMTGSFKTLNTRTDYAGTVALLTSRKENLENLKSYFTNNQAVTTLLKGTSVSGLNFSNYEKLISDITGRSLLEGSIPDIKSTALSFFEMYKGLTNGETYDRICDRYARAVCAWGYEYDSMMKTFALEELMETTKLMTILKAAYCPYFDEKVNYNLELMTLIDCISTTGSKYKDDVNNLIYGGIPADRAGEFTFCYKGTAVTPEMIKNSASDSKQLYEYILAYLCSDKAEFFPENYAEIVMSGDGNIEDVYGMSGAEEYSSAAVKIANLKTYMTALEGAFNSWNNLEEVYTKYVNQVNTLYTYLVQDKPGYVTCMIPGVKRTFLSTMGYVHYGDRFYSFLGNHWDNPGWTDEAFHGKDVQGQYKAKAHRLSTVRSEFVQHYSGKVYSSDDKSKIQKNAFVYMDFSEYQTIYEWYHDDFHRLYRSVPVIYTDSDGKVLCVEKDKSMQKLENPTLTEIFFYGAGIGFDVNREECENAYGLKMIKYTPAAEASVDLGIGDAKWDVNASSAPADCRNLFDVSVYYAYEDGKPTADVADKHSGLSWLIDGSVYASTWEYRIVGHGIAGNKNGSWSKDFEKSNWLITELPNKTDIEATDTDTALDTYNDCKDNAKLNCDQTYVFPSCVHDMSWKTYWQIHG